VTIISRYLTRSFLKTYASCLAAFVAIYLVIDFLEKIGRFSRAGATATLLVRYFLCKVPDIIYMVAPLAVLMGTVLTMGMLARQNEITAMRGCGISLLRLGRPFFLAAFLVSVLLLLAGEGVVPAANDEARYLEEVAINKKSPSTFFRQYNIWYRDKETILQARFFDPASRTLRGITLWQVGQGLQPSARLTADYANFTPSGWLLHQVEQQRLTSGVSYVTSRQSELSIPLDLKLADLKVIEKSADNLGFLALSSYCAKLEKGGYDTTRYRTLLHAKLSLPFAALVMAFLGIPFALRSSRSGGMAIGIGVSLGIGFAYHVINATLLSFGQGGALPPVVAAWAANFLFVGIGVWLALTVEG
jgi:lipopolysaccharide export system permease protein